MKQWNIGNTTVRNPERIKPALRVLSDHFLGKKFDESVQDDFFRKLIDEGVITGDPAQNSSRAQSGRKWASSFNQLGLARCWARENAIVITEPGRALLSEDILDEDIFLRQLLKLQIPSKIGGVSTEFSVHPFYLVLKASYELGQQGFKGVTKEELALFVVTTVQDDGIDKAIENIVEYRAERDKYTGRVAKRRYFLQRMLSRAMELYQDDFLPRSETLAGIVAAFKDDPTSLSSNEVEEALRQITATGKGANVRSAVLARTMLKDMITHGSSIDEMEAVIADHLYLTRGDTLVDYADTAARYSRITGLFTISGDKLVVKEDQAALAEALISRGAPDMVADDEFLNYFYNPRIPELPTDSEAFLTQDVNRLRLKAQELGATQKEIALEPSGGVLQLKAKRKRLEDDVLVRKEALFYRQQASAPAIAEIEETFEKIEAREIIGGSDYRPAWAEWAVWRSFLAINTITNPISETRNFKIDTDLNPIHHARGGVADMVFEYDDDVIIPAESTLMTSERQYNMEGEPVQTHVMHIADANRDKRVIGILIAPTIHPRTAQSYFNAEEWSERRKDTVKLSIVPLTFAQLISLLPGRKNGCINAVELVGVLDRLLDLKTHAQNGHGWLKLIEEDLAAEPLVVER